MAKQAIRIINSLVNFAMLLAVVLLFAIAIYALWDSEQLYGAARETNYTVYKPTTTNQGKTFTELQDINPEVIAWITVYGTHIDYPVSQARDNMKYVNTNAEGHYSLSGAIFLDCDNDRKFNDFNSILYGHHMQKKAMFGEIGSFIDKTVFDSHKYGNLFYQQQNHGVEFFAFLHVDAYDRSVYKPGVSRPDRQVYLDYLMGQAIFSRDIGVSIDDQIILLTTCSSSSTNGRDVLVGRISNRTFEDAFADGYALHGGKSISVDKLTGYISLAPLWFWLLLILIMMVLMAFVFHRNKILSSKQLNKELNTELLNDELASEQDCVVTPSSDDRQENNEQND